LRTSVQKMSGYDTVIADMATLAIEHLESDWYLLPSEKHRLLRAAAHALWLLDSNERGGVNAFQHKRIKRDRFGRWFRRYPIVPLYGDMFANLQNVLERCPNFRTVNPEEFFATSKKEAALVAQHFQVASQLPSLRTQAADFTSEFNVLLRRMAALDCGEDLAASLESRVTQTETAMTLCAMTLRGCRLMSSVSALLSEAVAHKCNHAAPEDLVNERAKASEWCDYERALRYNLNSTEKSALVELLAILKGLEHLLHGLCGDPETILRRGLHEQTQRFVHQTMGAPTRKAVKYEKKALKSALLQLRNMCADASGDINKLMDEEHMKSKEFKRDSHDADYPARGVPPSQTQLWLMRATARSLYDERSPHIKGSMMQEADLPKEIVKEMRCFVAASACYPYLLRLSSTLTELGDLSFLWMREFYLELCKRVQFPISMSLPAMLTEHILAAGNSQLMPMLLAPFEAYSDSARSALRLHRQQHLFVEIEAEANLVFDQVLYSLSEQLFGHFKIRAALALLPREKAAADSLVASDPDVADAVGKCWYATILCVRHARILGRPVLLQRLLAQRMNSMVRQSLDLALARFESKALDSVVDLHCALRVVRLTHSYLTVLLPDMDPFDAAWVEQSDSIAFLSFSSRVLSHTLSECLSDLIPNFAYRLDTATFQRPLPTPFTQPPERFGAPRVIGPHLAYGSRQLNAEYAMHAARASGSFGVAHATALVAVLDETGTQSMLSTLSKHVEELLHYEIGAYVAEVQEALPEAMGKLPSYQYGARGCYLFFEAKLKDIANYDELHSSVFHSFRRLGNALHLIQLLESAVQSHASAALQQMPPRGATQPAVAAATAVSSAWGQPPEESDMVLMAEQVAALSAPLSSSSSLFMRALINATNVVVPLKEAWLAGETPGQDLSLTDTTRAFHRVWSVLSFLYATKPFGAVDNATLFGDGMLFAGSLLLHILSQRHRFELLDFSSHCLSVFNADGVQTDDPSLHFFVQRATGMRRAHERFIAMLEARDAPTVYNCWHRL